jgi:hypothetical protein
MDTARPEIRESLSYWVEPFVIISPQDWFVLFLDLLLCRQTGHVDDQLTLRFFRNFLEIPHSACQQRHRGVELPQPVCLRPGAQAEEVLIEDFISPTILKRLDMDLPLFKAKITDWRSQVDCVMIDTAYNGELFNVTLS